MTPEIIVDFFSEVAASVFTAANITCYLFDSLRPTPMLSFVVRELRTTAGIVITASHNPKEYNGYKVYGSDGGQITDSVAKTIQEYISKVDIFEDVNRLSLCENPLIKIIPNQIEDIYYNKIIEGSLRKSLLEEYAHELSILYTPIHGSGHIPVREILSRLGFSNLSIVTEQALPNGDFPTVPYPNPEDRKVFEIALKIAEQKQPDIILGTAPDCDRIGVLTKERDGNYKFLTGNQVGVLLTDYLLKTRKEFGVLTDKDTIIKTIVSTDMSTQICHSYGVKQKEVLTGFKYIGELAEEFFKTGTNTFLLGFEESYGYLTSFVIRPSGTEQKMKIYFFAKGQDQKEATMKLTQLHTRLTRIIETIKESANV